MMTKVLFTTLFLLLILTFSSAFAPATARIKPSHHLWSSEQENAGSEEDPGTSDSDPSDIIAYRIKLEGDVNGGYFRACVMNEASRFRKLMGTMSPPDPSSKEAEIYIEGKRTMADSFLRWCKRGKVGLSQVISVTEVVEEMPTGIYEGFYIDMQ